jgi:small subunit ribosomal protein S16
MALKIRLSRAGARKRPYYRIVIADSRSPRDGRFIEKVGTYNPMVDKEHPDRLRLIEDRIKHWLDTGALPTDRVARFLSNKGLIAKIERRTDTKQSQPKQKAVERLREKEEKAKAAADAVIKATADAKAAADAVAKATADAKVAADAPAE